MKIINAGYEIIELVDMDKIKKHIERCGRTCYQSQDMITSDSAGKFIRMIINRGHESVLEHAYVSVLFTNDRGVSHEQVRHRVGLGFSQESTRFINYTKENKGGECTYIDIRKHLKNPEISFDIWYTHLICCETAYRDMIDAGEDPQIARSVLPNSLKTSIMITANLREWRTIFKQRTSTKAHPQMREVMVPLLEEMKIKLPEVFDDIIIK